MRETRVKNFVEGSNTGLSITKEWWDENGNFLLYTAGQKPIWTTYDSFPKELLTTENDILVARNGAGSVHIPELSSTYTDHVIRLRLKSTVFRKFLYYVLCNYVERIANEANDVSLATLSKSVWLALSFHFVPLPEQTAIANFLDDKCGKIDSLIEIEEKAIVELKEYKKSLIQNKLMNSKSDLRKLKWIGTLRNGLTYEPNDMCDADEGKLVLRSSNIQNSQLCFNDNVYVSIDIPNNLLLKENDLLICSRNGSRELVGKCALIDKKTAGQTFGAFMCVFRSDYNKFVYYFLQSHFFSDYIGSFSTSTINQLTAGVFNNIEMPFPSLAEQQAIAEYLDKKTRQVDELITIKQQKIDELKEYKKSLIYEYVTGKKEVTAEALAKTAE